MFYRMTSFYFRDLYFFYSEKNKVSWYDFGKIKLNDEDVFYYDVEKIDKGLKDYDILPTVGPYLVGKRFVEKFSDIEGIEIKTFKAVIRDENGGVNEDFMMLIVINALSCMDPDRSETNMVTYGDGASLLRINKLVIKDDFIANESVFHMKEKPSYIIANESFKNKCEGLKGFDFLPLVV